ncbi:helix-turn-helix domain-containing protein [Ciceribacter thiooxidans]|uniref:Helix-turn-helix domain-containing protein n=2 Tax=Ciceribacter thiooxidans TaxID=1969821 RepID=A0ABV7I1T2_9HYPH
MVATQKAPDEVDVRAGSRLKSARRLKRMSQVELARILGVTFQQIQKYENGKNRISAGKIVAAANALGVMPSFFFDEEDRVTKDVVEASSEMHRLIDLVAAGDALELNRHFARIKTPSLRRAVVSFVTAIATAGDDQI